MARPDLQVIGERRGALQRGEELARAGLHRAGHVRRLLEQVRPAHITHEEEVTRHHRDRLRRDRRVGIAALQVGDHLVHRCGARRQIMGDRVGVR